MVACLGRRAAMQPEKNRRPPIGVGVFWLKEVFLCLLGDSLRLQLEGKVLDCAADAAEIPRDLATILQAARERCGYLFV